MNSFLLAAALLSLSSHASQRPSERINPDDVTDTLAAQYDCDRHEVHADHVEYHDFTGDGQDELVLGASSCRGGHDIQGVYGRDATGKIYELPFSKAARDIHGVYGRKARERKDDFLLPKSEEINARHERVYGMLFGIVWWDLSLERGLLVETYKDTSGRDRPLVIRYKWDGNEFAVHSVLKTGPFRTSYDCAKSQKEVEYEICYVKALADLDLKLENLYRRRLRESPPIKRTSLQNEQREWLAKRNSCQLEYDATCVEELYKLRIGQLEQ